MVGVATPSYSHSVEFRECAPPSNSALISGGSIYTETETENQCTCMQSIHVCD